MNEEAQGAPPPEEQQDEAATPTPIVRGTTVTQILGRLKVAETRPSGNGAANNTRWVFDVRTKDGKPLHVSLIHFNSGRVCDPDVMSFTATPTNRAAYKAQPVLREESGALIIETEETPDYATFRVFVDVMHSATR